MSKVIITFKTDEANVDHNRSAGPFEFTVPGHNPGARLAFEDIRLEPSGAEVVVFNSCRETWMPCTVRQALDAGLSEEQMAAWGLAGSQTWTDVVVSTVTG